MSFAPCLGFSHTVVISGTIPDSLGEAAKQHYSNLTMKGKKLFKSWPSNLGKVGDRHVAPQRRH